MGTNRRSPGGVVAPARPAEPDSDADRRRRGAWYTPLPLVRHVVDAVLADRQVHGTTVRVLDPACGDGRFLVVAAERIRALGGIPELVGVDLDPGAVRAALAAVGPLHGEVRCADALTLDWGADLGRGGFDLVLGNPPFLSQLAADTTRGGASRHGGGPYADAAVEFLALAVRLARAPRPSHIGGRVGLVLPMSLLSSRDAGPVRRAVMSGAALRWLWWSPTPVFDASVRTFAVGLERGGAPAARVRRTVGPTFEPRPPLTDRRITTADRWGPWIADDLGVPGLDHLHTAGTLTDRAILNANFRDEYYGLVGAVRERCGPDDPAPPLVTTGLIDPGTCHWGQRPVRFAKQRFEAPVVDVGRLDPKMQQWAERKLVPKVLLATQTRVLEAVADPTGTWLPGVPVIAATPRRRGRPAVWSLAAVLTSPVASAWVAHRSAGTGLSSGGVRVSVHDLAELPWPAGPVDDAADALRRGDLRRCGALVDEAYGVPASQRTELLDWWLGRLPAAAR